MLKSRKFSSVFVILLVTTMVFVLSACNHKTTIKVGSKDFTESEVVSEIYALALEHNGYKVERVPNIASSVIPQAIKKGEIDIYPEYTGTIVQTILKQNIRKNDAAEVAKQAKKGLMKDKLTTLKYSSANDAQGIAIRTDIAKKYNIKTISDLQKNASKLRFASQGEFDKRIDGLPGLEKVYGKFNFKSHKIYDNSLKYKILANDKADVTPAYTTEGALADKNKYTVLVDDKHFWPPYNLVPVVRQETLNKNKGLAKVLDEVDSKLTTNELIKLNKKIDIDGQNYKIVAKDWYSKNMK